MYLTRRQREMLDCIDRFIQRNGYSPTLEEIGKQMGLSSLATVHKHLQNLEGKGVLRRNWNHSRAIELVHEAMPTREEMREEGVPLMGEVAAGLPIEAVEAPEMIDVPSSLLGGRENFVLKVRGDSMIDDGIRSGDLIIVESRSTAMAGQTVVALIDGNEATVKRYYPEGGTVLLQPANATMAPLRYPSNRVEIQGIVIGLMRRY